MTMVSTPTGPSPFEENVTTPHDITGFKRLVKSASRTAETLAPNDLPAAFQLSFSLMERISDLMLEAFAFLNSSCSEKAENLDFNGYGRKSPGSNSSPSPNPLLSTSPRFMNLLPTGKKTSNGSAKSVNGLNQTDEEAETNDVECSDTPIIKDSGQNQNILSPLVERPLRIDLPTEDVRNQPVDSVDLASSDLPAPEEQLSPSKRNRPDTCTIPPFSKKFARANGSLSSQLLNGRHGEATHRDWPLGTRMSTDVRRWRLSSTDRLNSLIDECERQVNGRKLYVCKFCGKVYEIKSSMRYHMKIIHLQMHLKTTEMQCRICGKQFTCVSAVNRHQAKCILSTYPEAGSHRMKNCLTLPPTTMMDPDSPQPISTTYADPTSGAGVSESLALSSCAGGPNPNDGHHINALFAKNSFHQVSPASTTLKSFQESAFFPDPTRSGFPVPGLYDFHDRSSGEHVQDNTFSPRYPFKTDPVRNGIDAFRNPILPYWPGISQLNGNISELTPLQLEMCMKAVVQGFHSNATSYCGTQNAPVPFTEPKSELPMTPRTSTTSRPSFSSIHTPSDTSELEPSQSLENDEVAIDLSARPCSESVMIESF